MSTNFHHKPHERSRTKEQKKEQITILNQCLAAVRVVRGEKLEKDY